MPGQKFTPTESIAELIEAALNADYTKVRRIGSQAISYFEKQNEPHISKRIKAALRKKATPLRASGQMEWLPVDEKSRMPLVEEQLWPDTPIFLPETVNRVFNSFIGDIQNSPLVTKEGLATKACLLVSGPPGTGKTLLASHIAARLGRPLYVARLDSIVIFLFG